MQLKQNLLDLALEELLLVNEIGMVPFIFLPSELNVYVMAGAEAVILRP